MKKASVFLVILVGALLIGACSTASTQDDELRDIINQQQEQINQLSEQLGQAQAPQEVEVTSVVEVTAEEPVEVTVPDTPVPPPTTAPAERSKVLLAGSYSGDDGRRFSKLEALAFTNGMEFFSFAHDEREDFYAAMDQPDVKLLIYTSIFDGGLSGVEADLLEMAEFVDGGGRILILTQHWWSESNPLFQRLFGVSLVQEGVLDTKHAFFFANESLPHYMNGLEVGFAQVGIAHYLASNMEGGEQRYIRSDVNGEERLWYVSSQDRRVTFMIGTWSPGTNLFDDQSIDFVDNEQAALNMLKYLTEN